MTTVTIPCLGGGLTDAPVWCTHVRGRNWCASVDADPDAPGGLQRRWWQRGRGDFFYVVPRDLTCGQVVEFGADYVSCNGHRYPERWYGVVLAVDVASLTVLQCPGALEACRARDLDAGTVWMDDPAPAAGHTEVRSAQET